jgi:2-methylisocitrate lyase-like PEP mutase family enzyme
MGNPWLRQKLEAGEFVVAPGVQDMITAVIARDLGFECVYATGYWMVASAYGLPDAGIATYSQMVDRVATVAQSVGGAAIIADADTGYGGLLNVHHTVRGYEAAGASAIQIEDQEFPKKCGHTPFKRVVPTEVMTAKIRVAAAARSGADTLIVARSDARQSEGFDELLRRCEAYAEAGADVIFPEALLSEQEMAQACRAIGKPVLANMANGGKTPIRSAAELKDIGFALAIFPSLAALAAAEAVRHALSRLKATGSSAHPDVPLYDFDRFCQLIGFEDVWAFERRWGETDAQRP